MKKNLVRAVLVAGLSLLFAGTVVVPASAAASSDSEQKVSRSVSKPLSEALKANTAKDWTTMLAKLKEAQAVTDRTDFDNYVIDRYIGLAYFNMGDKAQATTAFVDAVKSPAMPAGERVNTMHIALGLENDTANYAKVIEIGQLAVQGNYVDDTIARLLAVAYYYTNDYPNAAIFAQKSADLTVAAGKVPDRGVYEIVALINAKQKKYADEAKIREIMVKNYGNMDDWNRLIDISITMLSTSNKSYREIAALDVYRLMLTVGVTAQSYDYMAMADGATEMRLYGDAVAAYNAGVAKGALTSAQVGAKLRNADSQAKRDRSVLAQAEAAAAKAGTSKEDLSVAEAYYSYDQFADAARVAQRAISKGGAGVSEARLLLGMSQVKQGDKTTAAQTLANVDGDPAIARAAQLWLLYATAKPAAAPAAGAQQ